MNTWLEWSFEQFEAIWLTSWDQEKVKAFLTLTYNANVIAQFRYADWTNYGNKTVWIAEALSPSVSKRSVGSTTKRFRLMAFRRSVQSEG